MMSTDTERQFKNQNIQAIWSKILLLAKFNTGVARVIGELKDLMHVQLDEGYISEREAIADSRSLLDGLRIVMPSPLSKRAPQLPVVQLEGVTQVLDQRAQSTWATSFDGETGRIAAKGVWVGSAVGFGFVAKVAIAALGFSGVPGLVIAGAAALWMVATRPVFKAALKRITAGLKRQDFCFHASQTLKIQHAKNAKLIEAHQQQQSAQVGAGAKNTTPSPRVANLPRAVRFHTSAADARGQVGGTSPGQLPTQGTVVSASRPQAASA